MTGREFEDLVLFRIRATAESIPERFDGGRYGVQVAHFKDKETGELVVRPMRSLPDFEGVYHGTQWVFEAKVVSGASFAMRAGATAFEGRQLRFMLKRSRAGALCFVMIHWNARKLKTKEEDERTYAIPINPDLGLWKEWKAGELRTITRGHCENYGVEVAWDWHTKRAKKITPNVLETVEHMLATRELLNIERSA
jgi:penicillin-binding protein-related factor A (putative recombinase)